MVGRTCSLDFGQICLVAQGSLSMPKWMNIFLFIEAALDLQNGEELGHNIEKSSQWSASSTVSQLRTKSKSWIVVLVVCKTGENWARHANSAN